MVNIWVLRMVNFGGSHGCALMIYNKRSYCNIYLFDVGLQLQGRKYLQSVLFVT